MGIRDPFLFTCSSNFLRESPVKMFTKELEAGASQEATSNSFRFIQHPNPLISITIFCSFHSYLLRQPNLKPKAAISTCANIPYIYR